MESETIFLIFVIIILIGSILCAWAAMNNNKVLIVGGVGVLISGISFLVIMGLFLQPNLPKPDKPVHSFLARNLEDMQLDTVYTYNPYPSSEVWVNMDSLWINSYRSTDLYATKYSIIRQIK